MNTSVLEQIEADIRQLSLAEQLLLVEHLTHRIREHTLRSRPALADQLAIMASDPDIQRELRQIEAEFASTETDGLDVEQ